jgi:hypothetical protein
MSPHAHVVLCRLPILLQKGLASGPSPDELLTTLLDFIVHFERF